jgi:hypothetical protein
VKHLVSVQVFLGKIESWLVESTTIAAFLEEAFNTTIVSNKEENTVSCYHSAPEMCIRCCRPYSQHVVILRPYSSTLSTSLSYDNELPLGRPNIKCYSIRASSSSYFAKFSTSSPTVLRVHDVPFGYSDIFHVNQDINRRRLKTFLHYIAFD